MKYLSFLGAIFWLSSCSSGIKSSDIESLRYGESLQQIESFNKEKHLYRLDYLADGQVYRYETYYLDDTGEYYGFLFKEGTLFSASKMSMRHAHWSDIRDCTLFPPDFDLDVNQCLRQFNENFSKNSIILPGEDIRIVNEAALDRRRDELAGTLAEMIVLSPIIAPAAIVSLPLLAIGGADADRKRKAFEIRLGDSYQALEKYISSLPEGARAIRQNNGSIFISPIAFGLHEGKVIWIDMETRTVCRGLSGKECRVLRNSD